MDSPPVILPTRFGPYPTTPIIYIAQPKPWDHPRPKTDKCVLCRGDVSKRLLPFFCQHPICHDCFPITRIADEMIEIPGACILCEHEIFAVMLVDGESGVVYNKNR
jgi:hypothetical protein